MDTSSNSIRKYDRLKPEMLMAIFAIIISMSTLFVYIYQSNLMKQQQKMSVWPYLSYGPSWGDDYLVISLINKGIGPAIIKEVKVELDGNPLNGFHSIMTTLPDTIKTTYTYSSLWNGQVIMAGEKVDILTVRDPRVVSYLLDLVNGNRIVFEVCYASVYGETWRSYGLKVEESRCK